MQPPIFWASKMGWFGGLFTLLVIVARGFVYCVLVFGGGLWFSRLVFWGVWIDLVSRGGAGLIGG